jgi:hypothetical protein
MLISGVPSGMRPVAGLSAIREGLAKSRAQLWQTVRLATFKQFFLKKLHFQ